MARARFGASPSRYASAMLKGLFKFTFLYYLITGSLIVGGVLLAFPLGALLGVDPAYVYGAAVVVGAIGAILLILRSAWPKNEPPPVPPTY